MTETLQEDEDASLDSFFAKKDKSKKPKKKKKTKSDDTVQGTQSEQSKTQGDDWKDFEEEKEKDYSNLKIQTLAIMEESANNDAVEEADDNDGDDEDGVKKKGGDGNGKWNVPTPAPSQALPEAKELPGTQNVVGGKYVPPSVKRSAMMGSSTPSRKPLAAPDIQSKAAFPTLSAANQDLSTPNKSTDFEVVKRGIKTNEARVEDNKPRLDLGNRYDSLRR